MVSILYDEGLTLTLDVFKSFYSIHYRLLKRRLTLTLDVFKYTEPYKKLNNRGD